MCSAKPAAVERVGGMQSVTTQIPRVRTRLQVRDRRSLVRVSVERFRDHYSIERHHGGVGELAVQGDETSVEERHLKVSGQNIGRGALPGLMMGI